jgi:hypothetical protein
MNIDNLFLFYLTLAIIGLGIVQLLLASRRDNRKHRRRHTNAPQRQNQ